MKNKSCKTLENQCFDIVLHKFSTIRREKVTKNCEKLAMVKNFPFPFFDDFSVKMRILSKNCKNFILPDFFARTSSYFLRIGVDFLNNR